MLLRRAPYWSGQMFTRVIKPCSYCVLCKEKQLKYTHPVKWRNPDLFNYLKTIEPGLALKPDTCICRNCRDSLISLHKSPVKLCPRWSRVAAASRGTVIICEILKCSESAWRCTKVANKDEIKLHLKCALIPGADNSEETNLCEKHYRSLHKLMKPDSYKMKCAACSTSIKGSNYHKFRACCEPERFQSYLQQHIDFEGIITANDKVCMDCYRYSCTLSSQNVKGKSNHNG